MLKFAILNQKKVPVPIPIKNLKEALVWVESFLLHPDHTVTKISLDGQNIEFEKKDLDLSVVALDNKSVLELRIDSPKEISVQTVDALRNLSVVMEKSLKPMAVKCWQTEGAGEPGDLGTLCDDIDLTLDLLDHVVVLLDQRISQANIKIIQKKIYSASIALSTARKELNWKLAAKVILQQLEGAIIDLNNELCMIQKSIFESIADRPRRNYNKNLATFDNLDQKI